MSDPSALLRLELAPGSLRRARRLPQLAPAAGRRSRIVRTPLTLEDTAGRDFAAAGWLCAGPAAPGGDAATIPVAGVAAGAAPAPEDAPAVLAEGESETSVSQAGAVRVRLSQHRLARAGRDAACGEILLEGPADAAVALALQLAEALPAAWSGAAPLVAVAAALDIVEPPALRAGGIPFDLPEGADALALFVAVARHCLLQFDGNMQPVLRNRDIEGVHQMRVALRRLRSALSLFAPALPAGPVAPLVAELRWLNGPLGHKRDIDVFLAETLVPLTARLPDPRGLRHLATVLEDRREAAQAALESALRSPRCLKLRLGFEDLLLGLPAAVAASDDADLQAAAAQPAEAFAAALLQKRARKVRKLGRDHDSLDAPALHELRIRIKKLRYAVEFFRPLFGRRAVRRFLGSLVQLQDCLGALNDAAVGDALMRDVLATPAGDPAAAAIAGWFIGRQDLQLAHLGDAWTAYAGAAPFWKDALPD
jgi:CHAD domain-containing protein